MNGNNNRMRVGKYELGKTLGEGTFAKVKFAKNLDTGESVAIKVLDKDKILKHKMVQQIKREISTMKLVKHPYIVQLLEVMASKTKIYIVLEYVTGGELFDKIVHQKRLIENDARRYFQQLIDAVDYCHSRNVYHRDLKPENLLVDANGNLKISDFGLSALPQQCRADGLLHTTCGTPNYVAPEVINDKGYHGATADLWSCGVILFVLMAGYLPFDEQNLMTLYKKIYRAEFTCPSFFSSGARRLIMKILDPNPKTRITAAQIYQNDWFKKGYSPAKFDKDMDINLDDIDAVFSESTDYMVTEERGVKPPAMNAFELISLSRGLNLSGLFETREQDRGPQKESRFTSTKPANEIISTIEKAAKPLGFNVQKRDYKMKLQADKHGRKGHLSVATEVFEVAPSLFMVELRKKGGDTLEYHNFYRDLSKGLQDIVWRSEKDGNSSPIK
ncbi:CBL-interacting protein kinase 23 [Physcomitrium patens]|uniref:non-specific serine/threonine protein kinase n=1 Tax=Physcomitrium patens TaxID=3218 RepID=U5PZN3_PHYPA|nr:CBL-interacting protein kinase 23-like [Physcomitrium patens]XP_024398874.1 CBL-interacting protein kinase 23-like [Physcomitrium patens]XP_024398875.1 CBL-interacting protein kinase 23-like [Physcomitrium patens]XP_024398876.1 CBL-interacting protein kinase 23-like [Physcomitrium patens]AGY49228.1 CBL-interacting protein kinase 1 [Physcomitrium patens]PNR37898.1 hypothetical protein PHYPA_021008 [Physcomitrium patens]|eukprot:XP_024398873.1 CBL-interacting protein kinase 23-like [Physcomitrella patens]